MILLSRPHLLHYTKTRIDLRSIAAIMNLASKIGETDGELGFGLQELP